MPLLRRLTLMSMSEGMYVPAPWCSGTAYIDFLIASSKAICNAQAAELRPKFTYAAAHDAFTLLVHPSGARSDLDRGLAHRRPASPQLLDVRKALQTQDRPAGRHLSGKHRDVVKDINLINIVWADGDWRQPECGSQPVRIPAAAKLAIAPGRTAVHRQRYVPIRVSRSSP